MKHSLFLAAILNCVLFAAAFGQNRDGFASFELNAVAPPTQASKYSLAIDPKEKRPGNAAMFYMRAALLLSPTRADQFDKAYDAQQAKNQAQFNQLAAPLSDGGGFYDELQMASERQECDWNTGIEERGFNTLLPELNSMRMLANSLSVQAGYQMGQGKIDDSLATIRVMYQMGQDVAKGPVLVNGLVGVGITALTDGRLIDLMGRADSPNLYWALAGVPPQMHNLQLNMRGERASLLAMIPSLAKAQDLSAVQWPQVMNQLHQDMTSAQVLKKSSEKYDFEETLKPGGSSFLVLPAAQAHYAQSRKIAPDDVALMESATIVAAYYFDQYQQVRDEIEKSIALPYPQMMKSLQTVKDDVEQIHAAAPDNPFMELIPANARAAESFAEVDREIAALTAVEAIRSYAAIHDGKLPEHLEDISATPVPANPINGEPFQYKMENEIALLSDTRTASERLQYTIRIRK
jgi:hypothetical protein